MARKKFSNPFFPSQTSGKSNRAEPQPVDPEAPVAHIVKTKSEKLQLRKLKRENRDKRNLQKQKHLGKFLIYNINFIHKMVYEIY